MKKLSAPVSRREAIKTMGKLAVGAAIASTGLLGLTSCDTPRKKRLIFYFTATGNSLFVARELAGEEGELISIPQEIDNPNPIYDAEEIGFVFPTYVHIPPAMVQDFFNRSTFNADYLFAIATYGAHHGGIMGKWDKLAKERGYNFNYLSTVLMVDTALNMFDMEQQKAIDKKIPEQMAVIIADVNSRKDWHQPIPEEQIAIHENYITMTGMDRVKPCLTRSENYVKVTDACIACGICASVCPHGSWTIGSVAIPEGDCESCMSCIHNCPQKALTLYPAFEGMPAERNPQARYRHPDITLADIIRSNDQA